MLLSGVPPEGYLDASAGEPLHPAAREVLISAADQAWADPQAFTPPARRSRILLDGAIESLARSLGCAPTQVHGVHGDATSVALAQLLTHERQLIVSAIERDVVMRTALDHDAIVIGVDELGCINVEQLREALSQHRDGASISMQAANGEVGTIQPVAEIAALAVEHGALLHLDYAGAVARVPIVDATYISAPATTWAGPKGVGVVICAPGAANDVVVDAGRELSLPLLLAAAAALEARVADSGAEDARLRTLIDRIRTAISAIADAEVFGDPEHRLPHVLTASFLYIDGQILMDRLAREGIYIGSGSACIASRVEPSHVLKAMGRLTHGNIRIALAHGTREGDVDRLLLHLPELVTDIRKEYGLAHY